jgi:hypothetical protein
MEVKVGLNPPATDIPVEVGAGGLPIGPVNPPLVIPYLAAPPKVEGGI